MPHQTVIRKEEKHNDKGGREQSETYSLDVDSTDKSITKNEVSGGKSTHTIRRQKTDLEISGSQHDPNDSTQVECQICLADFQVGDKICWSNNPACVHTFHIACLEPWLMKHERCPVCRYEYLVAPKQDPKDSQQNLGANNHTTDTSSRGASPITRQIVAAFTIPLFRRTIYPTTSNNQREGNSAENSEPAASDRSNAEGRPIVRVSSLSGTNPIEDPSNCLSVQEMIYFDVESRGCIGR